jgi:hypothetical protein
MREAWYVINFDLSYARPLTVLIVSVVLLGCAVFAGDWLRHHRNRKGDETESKDMETILPAALTLLALLIGFSFSMAAGRYDQRKQLEEDEANAIGTEYVRAELVPAHTAQIQELLRQYTEQRILFYEVWPGPKLDEINKTTAELQTRLWAEIVPAAAAAPTPVTTLVAAGMNDVLNSQGYTQAMWWNRLPPGAWMLMLLVAAFCCFLFGYNVERKGRKRLLILPVIIALSLALVGDMDTPRMGLIHVVPQNLLALQASLR